jgi:hypothetical protein
MTSYELYVLLCLFSPMLVLWIIIKDGSND